ncbi:hypothetical protein A3734_06405 [Sulfitobacter sp. HI0054]|nr:hypothetical protein A3734_06405 [Sulfitobacter sp. HI0054]
MLTHANLNVYATDLGEEGIDLAKLYDYDLILLDLDLPDMNGHDVLRQLRLARIETPILILSGSDDTENKLRGFGFGADDYLTKPFHREELVARIHAIIRRSKGHSQSIIKTGQVAVNLDAKTVSVNDTPVHLTGKEYQMLELLSLRKGTTLTKEMFLNHLYGLFCRFISVIYMLDSSAFKRGNSFPLPFTGRSSVISGPSEPLSHALSDLLALSTGGPFRRLCGLSAP